MTRRDGKVSWRDRFGDEITCVRCLEVRDTVEVDRLLWCERCRLQARDRAARVGWLFGVVGALVLSAWIWLEVEPTDLVVGGWIATVVAAGWIGSKVARELAYGVMRFRNRRAVEASPPGIDPVSPPGGEA